MLEDLDHLGGRIQRLIALLDAAHEERAALAGRLAQAEAENQRLRALLALARDRVDHVLTRLPDPDAPPAAFIQPESGSHGTA